MTLQTTALDVKIKQKKRLEKLGYLVQESSYYKFYCAESDYKYMVWKIDEYGSNSPIYTNSLSKLVKTLEE